MTSANELDALQRALDALPLAPRAVFLGVVVAPTSHGFRSSFRDWAGEATAYPRELAEAALAHSVGDETKRAYRRGDALERRRPMMDAWSKFCVGE